MSELPRATRSRTVTEADTAAQFGPDFPAAASTPFVLGLAEVACHEAVAAGLGPDELTVGTEAHVEHLTPSRVGATLVADAALVERDGRRLRFAVEVRDGDRLAARVAHTRAVVSRARIAELLA